MKGDGGSSSAVGGGFRTTFLDWALKAWSAATRAHFRISRWGFVAIAAAGIAVLLLEPYEVDFGRPAILTAGWTAVGIGSAGLVRWWRLSHPPPILVVCRFTAPTKREQRAREVQSRILTDLRDNVPPRYRLVEVPEAVGAHQREFASALWRRLRAVHVLFGTVRATGEIDPRLLRSTHRYLVHEDHFTRDRTPQRTAWRVVADRLSGVTESDEVQYPFTSEAEAVVRGVEGRLLLAIGEPRRAETALREAISLAGDSPSHAVDDIRLALAEALDDQGRQDDALRVLRERAADEGASPDLLRNLAVTLTRGIERQPEDSRDEAIRLLRQASDHRGDPLRDATLYNLAKLLSQREETRQEGWDMLQNLAAFPGSHYPRAWYVLREFGAESFHRFQELDRQGREEEAVRAAKEAARWYGRSLRRRPRLYLQRTGPRPWNVRLGAEPSPIMIANLVDAHRAASHRRRRAFWEWRLLRIRRRFIKKATRHALAGDWIGAYKFFEWLHVGRGDDFDVVSRVGATVAAEVWGRGDLATARWQEAVSLEPHAVEWRRGIEERLRAGLDLR